MQETEETRVWFLGWEDPLEEEMKWQPTLVFLLRESPGERNLLGYSLWGHKVRHDWAHTHEGTIWERIQRGFLVCCPSWAPSEAQMFARRMTQWSLLAWLWLDALRTALVSAVQRCGENYLPEERTKGWANLLVNCPGSARICLLGQENNRPTGLHSLYFQTSSLREFTEWPLWYLPNNIVPYSKFPL